jgi:dTDP-4-dehydrorhamnose reductase
MKTVILGAGGQLATDLERVISDWEVVPLRHAELDVCDHEAVWERLSEISPEVVINTAAFHRVDECENQVEKAFRVNTYAVRNLAQVCAELDCTLMHISTDYVFGGEKHTPYTEEDLPNPLNVYGASKLAGEYFVRNICPRYYVVRTSGLYGLAGSSCKGENFVETMLRLAREGQPIRVVDDQVLAPTLTSDLAAAIRHLLGSQGYGLYHVTNAGECSWYEFAAEVFRQMSLQPDFGSISSGAFGAKACRPPYSVLIRGKHRSAAVPSLRPWRKALGAYLMEKQKAL